MNRLVRVVAILSLMTALPAAAGHQHEIGHGTPQKPAKARFAEDFLESVRSRLGPSFDLVDHEWNHSHGFGRFPLGGFGGISPARVPKHVPVIFVHGNNVDHADWYPVRDRFKAAYPSGDPRAWSDQELWALSYNGLGGNNGSALFTPNPERDAEHTGDGWDGETRVTSNEVNVEDLYDFILAVRAYTGSDEFSIVAHSLGVTIARRTLKKYPALRPDLVAFVGIAGGNHGTSFCPPGSEGVVVSCNEIAANTQWLSDLNDEVGELEIFAGPEWLMVYDGSGIGDPAFAGPTYAKSPALTGADNREFPLTYHNDLRLDPAIVDVYRGFLEAAEATP